MTEQLVVVFDEPLPAKPERGDRDLVLWERQAALREALGVDRA